MKPLISLITLGVDDLARARAFYVDGLGWVPSQQSQGDVVFIQAGALVLALWPRTELAEDAKLAHGERASFPGFALAQNLGSVEAVDRAMADAARAGATITKPAQKTPWGGYSGYFADPDGYLWEVAHNPHWPLSDDGHVRLPD